MRGKYAKVSGTDITTGGEMATFFNPRPRTPRTLRERDILTGRRVRTKAITAMAAFLLAASAAHAGTARSLAGVQLGQDASALSGFHKVDEDNSCVCLRMEKTGSFRGHHARIGVYVMFGKVLGVDVVAREGPLDLMREPGETVRAVEDAWGVTFREVQPLTWEAHDDAGAWMRVRAEGDLVVVVLHSAELERLQSETLIVAGIALAAILLGALVWDKRRPRKRRSS